MINRVLDEVLSEQDSEFDADTRFALAWFQQELATQAPGMKVVIPPPGEGIEL